MTAQWERQDKAATDGCRQLHQKLEQLRADFVKMSGRLAILARDVAEMKPIVKKVEQDRWRFEGMKSLSKIIWLSGGAFLTGMTWVLYTYFGIGKPPG